MTLRLMQVGNSVLGQGGSEQVMRAINEAAQSAGWDATLVGGTRTQDGPPVSTDYGDGLHLRLVPALSNNAPEPDQKRPPNPGQLIDYTEADKNLFVDALAPVVEEVDPDIVIAHVTGPATSAAILELTGRASQRIYVPHIAWTGSWNPLVDTQNLPGWTAIMASSNWHANRIRSRENPLVPVHTVHPRVAIEMFGQKVIHPGIANLREPGEMLVMCPSRFENGKGHKFLPRAMAEAERLGVRIRLIVTSPDDLASPERGWGFFNEMMDVARPLGVADRIHPVSLSGLSMSAAEHTVDVAVVASYARKGGLEGETCCIAAIEIMATGTPLAAVNSTGLTDYFIDGVNGIGIPLDENGEPDPRGIAVAIVRANKRRVALAIGGPDTAANFGPEPFAAEFFTALGMPELVPVQARSDDMALRN